MASEEVMVAQNQGIGQKITQVAILLQTQGHATITAINMAIPAAVNLVELIKHRVKGIHQVNSFEKVPDTNKTRLKIRLSFESSNTNDKGYQAPLPADQVQEKSLDELKKAPVRTGEDRPPMRRGRRGRGRGSRGPRADRGDRNERTDRGETHREDDHEERSRVSRGTRRPRRPRNQESGQTREDAEGESRPRGRGGFRGRGRGGFDGDSRPRGGRFPRGRGERGDRGDRGDRRSRRAPRSAPYSDPPTNPPASIPSNGDPWGSS